MSTRISSMHRIVALLVCVLGSLIGCGKGGPSLVKVTGSVTVDGKPASGATLIFHPASKDLKLIPSATADESGKFKLATDASEGVPVGSYDVTVTWPDPAVQPTPAQKLQGFFELGPDLLQGRYAKKGSSGLKIDITSSSKELPPIQLTK